jgi:hypothetical protein
VHGDIATASIVVNSLPKILEVAPGLHTMRDMPLPAFFGGIVKGKGKGKDGEAPAAHLSGARERSGPTRK